MHAHSHRNVDHQAAQSMDGALHIIMEGSTFAYETSEQLDEI
jgi:hypothetical protein